MNSSATTVRNRTVACVAATATLILLLFLTLSSAPARLSAAPVPLSANTPLSLGRSGAELPGMDGVASSLVANARVQPVTCRRTGFLAATTDSSTGTIVRQCTATVPTDGALFISTDGSAEWLNGPYSMQFWTKIDSVAFDLSTTRWVDV